MSCILLEHAVIKIFSTVIPINEIDDNLFETLFKKNTNETDDNFNWNLTSVLNCRLNKIYHVNKR